MKVTLRNIGLFIIPSAFIILSGCVGTTTHQALQKECAVVKEENEQLQMRLTQLEYSASSQKESYAEAMARKEEQERAKQDMIEELKEEISAKEVEIKTLEGAVRVKLVERLFFDSGSATVKKKGREILARIAPILKRSESHTIRITGHADELPPGTKLRKRYPSNWELSVARATSVIQVLQWGYGVDPKRMVAEGVAHYRPLPVKNGEDVRAINRTVEIMLVPSKN